MLRSKKLVLLGTAAAIALQSGSAFAQAAPQPAEGSASEEEIIVTGIRGSVQRAQNIKRDASSVVEAVTLEDLGKFSDSNIADTLQRVPGVQIERNDNGVSGDRVSIRGLGPAYVQVSVNGRTPLSTGDEGVVRLRQFNLDPIPTEVISGLLVYKTPTADLVESGLAGTVEIKTLRPLDYKNPTGRNIFASLTLRGEYDDQSDKISPRISGIVGGKLSDTLGVYVSGIWTNADYRKDEVFSRFAVRDLRFDDNSDGTVDRTERNVLTPSNLTTSSNRGKEKRLSFAGGLQWKPSDTIEFNTDFVYAKYDLNQDRPYGDATYDIYNAVSRPGGFVTSNGALIGFDTSRLVGPRSVNNQAYALRFDNGSETYMGGANLAWRDNGWSVVADYGYSKTKFVQELRTFIPNSNAPNSGTVIFDGTGEIPTLTGLTNINLPAGTLPALYFARLFKNDSDSHAARLDIAKELSNNLTLKFGGRFESRSIGITSRVIVAFPGDPDFPASSGAALIAAIYPNVTNDWLNGRVGFNQQFSTYNGGQSVLPALYARNYDNSPDDPGLFAQTREKTYALYGQLNANGSFFGVEADGNVGVRAVRTDLAATAFTATSTVIPPTTAPDPAFPGTSELVTGRNKYWTILPSANLNLKVSPALNWRFGVSRVMSRPEYEDTAPRNNVVFSSPNSPLFDPTVNPTGRGGNTFLEPLTAWQFDTTLEFYTPNDGAIYGSVFYKDVDNFILSTTNTGPLPGFGAQLFDVTQPVNFTKGSVIGFEVGANQPLPFLADGFGVQANYTFVDTKIESDNGLLVYGFPGASKHNFNAVAYYENGGFGARIAYSYRSDFFQALGGGNDRSAQPTFTKGYGQLNATASYKLTDNIEFTLAGINLTKTNRRDYIVEKDQFRSFIRRSRAVSLAVRVSY